MGGCEVQPFFGAVDYLRSRAEPAEVPWRLRRAIEDATRRGVDWWVWRIATSEHLHDSYADIRDRWSFGDTLHAHLVLDAIDAAKPEPRE